MKKVCTKEELEKVRLEKVVTILFPYKKDAEYINNKSYIELGDVDEQIYKIRFISNIKKDDICEDFDNLSIINNNSYHKQECEFLANNIIAYQVLKLKIGTHVMCVANLSLEGDNQIANGSQGVVVGFKNRMPLIKFNNIMEPVCISYYSWPSETNKKIAGEQIPLIYAGDMIHVAGDIR